MEFQELENFLNSQISEIDGVQIYQIKNTNTSTKTNKLSKSQSTTKKIEIPKSTFNIYASTLLNFTKMIIETVGRNIAHEIANPLTALNMNLEYISQVTNEHEVLQTKNFTDTINSSKTNIDQIKQFLDQIRRPIKLNNHEFIPLSIDQIVWIFQHHIDTIGFNKTFYLVIEKEVNSIDFLPEIIMYLLYILNVSITEKFESLVLSISRSNSNSYVYHILLFDMVKAIKLPLTGYLDGTNLNLLSWYINFVEKTISKFDGEIEYETMDNSFFIKISLQSPDV